MKVFEESIWVNIPIAQSMPGAICDTNAIESLDLEWKASGIRLIITCLLPFILCEPFHQVHSHEKKRKSDSSIFSHSLPNLPSLDTQEDCFPRIWIQSFLNNELKAPCWTNRNLVCLMPDKDMAFARAMSAGRLVSNWSSINSASCFAIIRDTDLFPVIPVWN